MLLCYVIYCIALHFNPFLERWAHSLKLPIKLPSKEEQSALVTYKNLPETTYTQNQAVTSLNTQPQSQTINEKQDLPYNDPNSSWDPNAAWGDVPSSTTTNFIPQTSGQNNWDSNYSAQTTNLDLENTAAISNNGQKSFGYNSMVDVEPSGEINTTTNNGAPQPKQQNPDFYKSKEIKLADMVNPLDKPVDGGIVGQVFWAIVYPIHYMCRLTMPDCRTDKYKNWYPFTFVISMIWISFYSYFMVWMITIIGATLGIPDTVMGLTFVAAGVSVPDALSSIAVIKEGYGDMAVSNAVGSNVFDILICLGLPWFIQTAIIKPGSHVNVISKGLAYSTLSLLSTVFFLLFATHMNGWKLDKRLGVILMFWYVLFITIASLYELNVFGQLNPPECLSKILRQKSHIKTIDLIHSLIFIFFRCLLICMKDV